MPEVLSTAHRAIVLGRLAEIEDELARISTWLDQQGAEKPAILTVEGPPGRTAPAEPRSGWQGSARTRPVDRHAAQRGWLVSLDEVRAPVTNVLASPAAPQVSEVRAVPQTAAARQPPSPEAKSFGCPAGRPGQFLTGQNLGHFWPDLGSYPLAMHLPAPPMPNWQKGACGRHPHRDWWTSPLPSERGHDLNLPDLPDRHAVRGLGSGRCGDR
jgi:hypothetical protein